MKTVVEAMDNFFRKQTEMWEKLMQCKPLYPWDASFDQALFQSEPDEDGYAEWLPAIGRIPTGLPRMCTELTELFGARRFWQMNGSYRDYQVYFPAIPTDEAAVQAADTAIRDGEFHMGKGKAMLATVAYHEVDDLWLVYDQADGTLYLYDMDDESFKRLSFSLVELIGNMEVLI